MPDEAHEPLITPQDETLASPSAQTQPQPGLAAWLLLSCTAGLSGLLFGYDTGVVSSTLIALGTSLGSHPASDWDKSLITAMTSLCALLSSAPSGWLADTFGRKPVISWACGLFVIGALIQACATEVWLMVCGRGVVGLAVGTASGIVPVYVSEIAPANLRGRLVTVQSLMITGGQVIAYLVGWATQGRWRVAVGLGALPAVVQAGLLIAMCESPRWLVMSGRRSEAGRVLAKLNPGQTEVENDGLLRKIETQLAVERAAGATARSGAVNASKTGLGRSLDDLLFVPSHRRALTIACMLQGFQQLCAFNVCMYFSATIFAQVGFEEPIIASLTIAGTNFLFTLLAFGLVDTLGRRQILLYTIPFVILGLVLISTCFRYLPVSHAAATTVVPAAAAAAAAATTTSVPAVLLVASMILYVAAYATGLGCVPWQQSELFPLGVRSLGSGIATATNWSANTLVGITFLPLMSTIGASATFGIYVFVCVAGYLAVWLIYPETKGLELEDISELLDKGWVVR